MNLADVFTIVFVILGFLVVFLSYWLMAAGLFPQLVERCATTLGRAPFKSVLLGAVTLVPLVVIGLVVSSKATNGAVKGLGLALALLAMMVALFGSAGLALRIGQGLRSARDEHDPWRRVLRGGIVLGLTFVMPFLGTFFVMPLAFISGFGAFLLSCHRKPELVTAPAAEPVGIPAISSPAS